MSTKCESNLVLWFIIRLGKLIIRGSNSVVTDVSLLEEYIYSKISLGRLNDAILPPRATPQFHSSQVSMLRHQRHQLLAVHCWLILLIHHLPTCQYILSCLLLTLHKWTSFTATILVPLPDWVKVLFIQLSSTNNIASLVIEAQSSFATDKGPAALTNHIHMCLPILRSHFHWLL